MITSLLLAAATPATSYFPPSLAVPTPNCRDGLVVRKEPQVSAFEAQWFGKHLAAAGEPSLPQAAPAEGTTIRFTWLRTFHAPVTVRVVGLGSPTPRLVARQLSGHGGYDPGQIALRVDRPLTGPEAKQLIAIITEARPFPSGTETLPPCTLGMDGAEWLMESINRRGYRFNKTWSPSNGGVRRVGMAMLTLTGWRVTPIY